MQLLNSIRTELTKKSLTSEQQLEVLRCQKSCSYFIKNYCYIYNATLKAWVKFELWESQRAVLLDMHRHRQSIMLKARQLGLSWLAIGYALWLMRFHPAAAVLLFSQRDEEAIELLSRMTGVYDRLPDWLKDDDVTANNKHEFALSNGSSAKSFPTTAGRSYTGSLVLVDEADYIEDLDALINAVKPTIDAGGKMMMISTSDKSNPESAFKRIYRAARKDENEWKPIFLAWTARPERNEEWYDAQRRDVLARTGALDDLWQEYPATDTEALAPRSLDKRINPLWLEICFEDRSPLPFVAHSPALVGLEIYIPPMAGAEYVIGCDPAEGNPTSDDSALTVLDMTTGEECCVLAGKFEPSVFGSHILSLSSYYANAPVMVERNNHGHAVIGWLQDNVPNLHLLKGHDDKPGWMSSKLGKALLYAECAEHFRTNAESETAILHSFASYRQLASIEGATLRAPENMHDDRADAFALAQVGRIMAVLGPVVMKQGRVKGRGGESIIRRGRAAKGAFDKAKQEVL